MACNSCDWFSLSRHAFILGGVSTGIKFGAFEVKDEYTVWLCSENKSPEDCATDGSRNVVYNKYISDNGECAT